MSCQYNKDCKFCKFIPAQELDLFSLVLYTYLPELWDIFQYLIVVSPVTETGFSFINAETYLKSCELPQVTHNEFWSTMVYFLNRTNEKFMQRRKMRLKQLKEKS